MSASLESLMPEAPAIAGRSPLADLAIFIAIGGGAALGFALLSSFAVGLHSGAPDWLVSAACYALFIGPVYLLHRRFSFQSDASHATALPRYIAVQLNALCLAMAFSFLCYSVLGMRSVVAGLIVIGLTSGVNFIVLKVWAFARN